MCKHGLFRKTPCKRWQNLVRLWCPWLAVPPTCKKLTPLNWKLFLVRTSSNRRKRLVLVGLILVCGLWVSCAILAAGLGSITIVNYNYNYNYILIFCSINYIYNYTYSKKFNYNYNYTSSKKFNYNYNYNFQLQLQLQLQTHIKPMCFATSA